MNSKSHQLVANLALACLSSEERHILYPRWGGIESGSTLSDDFRIMWEPARSDDPSKQLVHRHFVDSLDPKNHGGATRAYDHASGSLSFARDYIKDPAGSYSEDEFLENLGMFLGVVSHHIADLCTPVHVGHKLDCSKVRARSKSAFHQRVERDIDRLTRTVPFPLRTPTLVPLSRRFFEKIAQDTYSAHFLSLEGTYGSSDLPGIQLMVSQIMERSVYITASVWHSVLLQGGMLRRKWSMQPLL